MGSIRKDYFIAPHLHEAYISCGINGKKETLMQKRYIRWILAIIITLSAAVYQRMTGPTYPKRVSVELNGQTFNYKLPRSHGGTDALPIQIAAPDTSYRGTIFYRRYKTDTEWHKVEMKRSDGALKALLPHQPPAGKLEYFVELSQEDEKYDLPNGSTVVVRFKGGVPLWVLLPHILFMFIAMLLSNMSGLEAFAGGDRTKKYVLLTTISLFLGGMILGPMVQKFAFGAYWTGIPFGWDLTDNKTLFAIIGWLLALIRIWNGRVKKNRWWVVAAAIILLLVYSIPHSTMGSELDYSKMEVVTGE